MLRRIWYFIKCILFLAILAVCLIYVNKVLIAKNYFNERWPSTTTAQQFYKMEKNTVDVLFLGSSHSVSGFNPQVLYDTYGIRSYNLGTPQQNLLVSYYWLMEALRYQKPKAVVLECTFLYEYTDEPLNSKEAFIRSAMDFMRIGDVKRDAIKAICQVDENQSELSYYLPNIRYHSRWTELGEEDFDFRALEEHPGIKGFSALNSVISKSVFSSFEVDDTVEGAEPLPVMYDYFKKITELCEQTGIDLVLVVTPCKEASVAKYNAISHYAKSKGLIYVDFLEKSTTEASGFVLEEDLADSTHCNYKGAEKVTKYIGEILSKQLHIEAKEDAQWSHENSDYDIIMGNYKLKETKDLKEYVELLKQDRYVIFLAGQGDYAAYLTDEVKARFSRLGLKMNLPRDTASSYIAVIDGTFQEETMDPDAISIVGRFRNHRSAYEIMSSTQDTGNSCSIKVDGKEYALNKRGINIVVYDQEMCTVVDAIAFDTGSKDLTTYK